MKKFILLIFLLFSLIAFTSVSVYAQVNKSYTFPTVAGDSLATADTVFKVIPVSNSYQNIDVQVSIKKGTGTLDGGVNIYASVNGNQYSVVGTVTAFAAVPTFGSLNDNGVYTHTATVRLSAPPGTKIIVAVTQAGSLTASPVQVSYVARPK